MKTVAIISEYNPFHNGHLYQISEIRKEYGPKTNIIAIMSGNFTQRGAPAIMDKWSRAEAAVKCGVNLVLELPFPYSASSADFFANAGVHIANSLGCVDILSFGSESGDITSLSVIAKNLLSDFYSQEIKRLLEDKRYADYGYPAVSEVAYKNCFGDDASKVIFEPNNILALEYIKAIEKQKSGISLHTVKRAGANYSDKNVVDNTRLQSARTIRNLIETCDSAKDFMPEDAFEVLNDRIFKKKAPSSAERASSALLSHFRLSPALFQKEIHDADGGIYNRLRSASFEATDINSLINLSATKKYTTARIRRAAWFSFFGVTSSDLRTAPTFSQILAFDTNGQALLKKIKEKGEITLFTKPSFKPMSDVQIRQKELSDNADFIYQLMLPMPKPASEVYKHSPFVKK